MPPPPSLSCHRIRDASRTATPAVPTDQLPCDAGGHQPRGDVGVCVGGAPPSMRALRSSQGWQQRALVSGVLNSFAKCSNASDPSRGGVFPALANQAGSPEWATHAE